MNRAELNIQEGLSLAGELFAAARFEEAGRLFRQIVDAAPGCFDAVHGVAASLGARKEYGGALPWLDRAMGIALEQLIAVSLNKSVALGELNHTDEAIKLVDGILALKPDDAATLYHRGILKMQHDRWADAICDFDAALAINQDLIGGDAIYCRSYCELALGDYVNGFRDFEYRQRPPIDPPENCGEQWIGEQDLNGKTILILHEQGQGDMIMFARYFPMLVARGAKVHAFLPAPLVPLFDHMPGVTAFSSFPELRTDFWVHILSLAYCFGTTFDAVPPSFMIEYSQSHLDKWRRIIPKDDGQFNVGLCWAGSPDHKFDKARSIPLALLEPIVALRKTMPWLRFFGLQPDIRDTDRKAADTLQIEHIGQRFQDFRRTAHALRTLDLVISVDTATAHMAGVVGVSTLVLLSKARSYWIWPHRTDMTPWYSSLRTISQTVEGNWGPVIHDVAAYIEEQIAT
jgi:hypothetical protein